MTNLRGLLLLGLPLVAAAGLVSAVLLRRSPDPISAARTVRTSTVGESAVGGESTTKARPATLSRPPAAATRMPAAKDIGSATANARVQTTYANFRIAVANDNKAVQKALLPVLQKDRETALWYARDDVAEATTEQDRTIALRTLKALEQ